MTLVDDVKRLGHPEQVRIVEALEAAQALLTHVDDPLAPPSTVVMDWYSPPVDPATALRRQADLLETKSRAVRRLKAALHSGGDGV